MFSTHVQSQYLISSRYAHKKNHAYSTTGFKRNMLKECYICTNQLFCCIYYNLLNAYFYTCQLFLRYRREIFIMGVLRFLKTTRSFPKIPEEARSLPKTSEVSRRRLKSSEDVRSLLKLKLSRKRLATGTDVS